MLEYNETSINMGYMVVVLCDTPLHKIATHYCRLFSARTTVFLIFLDHETEGLSYKLNAHLLLRCACPLHAMMLS